MLCLKKRRTYSFTQGTCNDIPRRSSKEKNGYNETLNMAVTTLPRKHRSREERSSGGMVLTVTEDTPADMLAGSMELLVQLPRDHNVHTQRVTVPRSTPMMDLLVQIATAHKLSASSYTLQAIGERGLVLPHQPNTPIGALDALQVKLLPKQGTFLPRKTKQANQPFETTFRLQVLLPRNQLYVSRVSPKMNLGKILEDVCNEKNLDKNKYELRHPANVEETLDLSLSLQDYHLQEVMLYAKQGRQLGAALSSQDIMALQRQEERRRQQAKQSVFGFMFRKSKESSLSIDSLGGRSVSPARSDETGRSVSPLAPPSRPLRKRRPAPKPPVRNSISGENDDETKDKLVISHSRNSSDSSGYHEASVLSDNPDSGARMPETLPRRSKPPCKLETSRKLEQTSQASKSLGNLAIASGGLSHGISSTSISSTGIRKKRAAPPPPIARPLSSAISTQALERIVDSEESLTSDIDISKSPSDIAASSKANSDIGVNSKANSDIGVHSMGSKPSSEIGYKIDAEFRAALADHEDNDLLDIERSSMKIPPPARFKQSSDDKTNDEQTEMTLRSSFEKTENVDIARLVKRDNEALAPTPKPRIAIRACETLLPVAPRRKNLESTLLDATTYLLPHAVESSIVNDDEINASKPRFEANQDEALFSDDGEKKFAGRSNSQDTKLEIANMLTSNIEEITRKKRPSSNVESMNIYDETKFSQEEISKDDNSSTEVSCAIISTIPKCAHLTPNTEDKVEEKNQGNSTPDKQTFELVTTSKNENLPMPKCPKVFRSQSVVNDFEINPLEKHIRHLTSHPEDITCALNPNFSLNVLSLETRDDVDETRFINDEDSKHDNGVEIFPQFVTQNTNLGCQEDFKLLVNDDCWEPQLIEQSGSGDRTMETDILLQKVSDTLSNSLPIAKTTDHKITGETKAQDKMLESITNDESDGIHESFDIFVKANNVKSTKHNDTNRESLSGKVNLGNSPNATMNSQQDTSDYVSAVGDDLSITDWEYQLPAPPSAFRDNITPEFDGYDTITLRSVEAFKETVVVPSDDEKSAMVDSSLRESPIPPPSIFNEDSETSKFSIMPEEIVESREKPEKPKPSPQTFELKKEIISELSTKIENGTLPRTSGKNFEDTRRTTVELSAPKIAPVDNTLSNFTITTYSRQKSLNIFEEEATEEKRNFPRAKKSEEKINTFVSSATSKRTNESDKENFGSRGSLERIVDNFQSDKRAVLSRAQSVENIIEPEVEFKRSETHSTQHDSLLRRTMSSNGQEKSTNVHRSKSYITLANNSKYRGDVDGEKNNGSFRNDNVVSGMMKSTSVTNLNHELPRSNEKFSQWRENILKRQEEPSKEKQLQSLQVLKNILPRLKTPQQTEENIVDSSNEKTHFDHGRSNTLSEGESMESKSIASESKPQKKTEDATTKRYKYTGPPAINLGSWSERPRANVQLKKDTDYKFGANDNNITGAKTVINLNGTRNERNDDKRELTLSRSVSKNESTTHRETPQDRRDSEEDVAKTMMTQKTITGFKKSASNRMMIGEPKSISRIENKPIVTSVALKKTQIEKPDIDYETVEKSFEDDDVKIDTKPVNFKELTKTFGQEVCLRPKPKRTLQNRHSDYYGMRPEMAQNFTNTNGQSSFWDNANPNVTKFGDSIKNLSNGIQRDATIKRCTSIVRIESHNNNNNRGLENCDTTKNHTTSTKINGPMPVVKGFKIRTSENPMKIPNVQQENDAGTNSSRKTSKVPIPPTMPIITGVTLKNSTTRPKSLQISNADPHDQLLESIRNFGGRDRLRSVNISS